jgi:hypothetical protein
MRAVASRDQVHNAGQQRLQSNNVLTNGFDTVCTKLHNGQIIQIDSSKYGMSPLSASSSGK